MLIASLIRYRDQIEDVLREEGECHVAILRREIGVAEQTAADLRAALEAFANLLLHVLASDRRRCSRRVHVDACRKPRWRDRTGKSACRRWHAGEPPTLRVQGSQPVARR